jgi:hypothetical protein
MSLDLMADLVEHVLCRDFRRVGQRMRGGQNGHALLSGQAARLAGPPRWLTTAAALALGPAVALGLARFGYAPAVAVDTRRPGRRLQQTEARHSG